MKAPFSRPLGDENDKLIFGLSSFGGIVGILGIRIVSDTFFPSRGISPWDVIAILLAIGVIGAYVVRRCNKNRSGISVDRASDNVYYLGLLYSHVACLLPD